MMNSPPPASDQRRHFSRVLFKADANLTATGRSDACEVRDLSLKGALLKVEHPALWPVGEKVGLDLTLGATGKASIRMKGTIAHHAGIVVGMRCLEIDLDSITHLRRLVELNVGDEAILQRELAALSAD
jgi:hypothetical protein